MKKIVALGGGDMLNHSTRAIDQEIVRLAGKKSPQFLFIPTASSDDEEYWLYIKDYFGSLGCKTDVLRLIKAHPPSKEIETKILSADIIYVGGGNALKMMRRWRHLGVDKILTKAYNQGTVMCGVSAGAYCWFESGHSNARSFYNPDAWDYIKVTGLGLLKGTLCPHYDSVLQGVKRRKKFQDMIRARGGIGIALDDNCALVCLDNNYKIIASQDGAQAYKVYKKDGLLVEEKLEQTKNLRPLRELS